MEKERFLIALKDFEAFNPHYDLEKPIKVKKGSILLVDGGFPHSQLTTMSDNGMTLFSLSGNDAFEDIYNICRANNIDIVDFRLISKTMKYEFLKPGVVKFPIFYWFEDYEVLPLCKQNEGKEYKMVDTFNMFGKPCGMVVKITDSDLCVFDENQRLIMIVDKLNNIPMIEDVKKSTQKAQTTLEDITKAYLDFAFEMQKMLDKTAKYNANKAFADYTGGELMKEINKNYAIYNRVVSLPESMENEVLSMDAIVNLCYQIFK